MLILIMAINIVPVWFRRYVTSIITSFPFISLVMLCITYHFYSNVQRSRFHQVEVALKHGIENCFLVEVHNLTFPPQQCYNIERELFFYESFRTDILSNQVECVMAHLEGRGLLGLFLSELNFKSYRDVEFIIKKISEDHRKVEKYYSKTPEGGNRKEFLKQNNNENDDSIVEGEVKRMDEERDQDQKFHEMQMVLSELSQSKKRSLEKISLKKELFDHFFDCLVTLRYLKFNAPTKLLERIDNMSGSMKDSAIAEIDTLTKAPRRIANFFNKTGYWLNSKSRSFGVGLSLLKSAQKILADCEKINSNNVIFGVDATSSDILRSYLGRFNTSQDLQL